jgi:hypothetical protein
MAIAMFAGMPRGRAIIYNHDPLYKNTIPPFDYATISGIIVRPGNASAFTQDQRKIGSAKRPHPLQPTHGARKTCMWSLTPQHESRQSR